MKFRGLIAPVVVGALVAGIAVAQSPDMRVNALTVLGTSAFNGVVDLSDQIVHIGESISRTGRNGGVDTDIRLTTQVELGTSLEITAGDHNDAFLTLAPVGLKLAQVTDFSIMKIAPTGEYSEGNQTQTHFTSLSIEEPKIGSGMTVTNAATLRVVDAPTEGTNNYALWVDSGLSQFDGGMQVAGPATFDGQVSLASPTFTSLTLDNLTVTDNATFDGQVTLTNPIFTNLSLTGTLDVAGAATFDGQFAATQSASIDGDLSVTGAATFDSTLFVTKAVSLESSLQVAGPATFDSTFTVTGDFTGSGDVAAATLNITGTHTGPSGTWDSGGVDIAASDSFAVAGTDILADAGGTLTLSNVDAIDATTEATLEAAIDALSSLTTVGTITSGAWSATDVAVAAGGTGASDAPTAVTNLKALGQGRHTVWIPAQAMIVAAATPAASTSVELTSNFVTYAVMDFDQSAAEYVSAQIAMPTSWDEGTVFVNFNWTAASGSGGVSWNAQCLSVGEGDALDTTWGATIELNDTLTTANDNHRSSDSNNLTCAGTPAANDLVVFRIYRDPADPGDTLAADARLLGFSLLYTVAASSDS
jgi:hypothetical protein